MYEIGNDFKIIVPGFNKLILSLTKNITGLGSFLLNLLIKIGGSKIKQNSNVPPKYGTIFSETVTTFKIHYVLNVYFNNNKTGPIWFW